MPPIVKRTPIVILRPRDCGMVNSRPNTEILRAGIRFSSAAVIAKGGPSSDFENACLRKPRPSFRFRARRQDGYMRTGTADCEKAPREKVS